jgi:GTP-binding protein HflX
VVDISHPGFEEQIGVVNQTLQEIGAADKPTLVVFNKTDAYSYVRKDEDDLSPRLKENLSLDELKNSWMASNNAPCIFISALRKQNVEDLRSQLYEIVRDIHITRYPYDNFLF